MPGTEEIYDFNSPKFSPDGDTVASFVHQNGGGWGIYLYDLAEMNGFEKIFEPEGYYEVLDWSADGEWIVYASEEGIYRVRNDGTDNQLIWDNSIYYDDSDEYAKRSYSYTVNNLSCSSDGQYIAIDLVRRDRGNYNSEKWILLMNYDGSGEPHRIVSGGGSQPMFTPSGEELLFTTGNEYYGTDYINKVSLNGGGLERLFDGNHPTTQQDLNYIYFLREGDIWRYRMY